VLFRSPHLPMMDAGHFTCMPSLSNRVAKVMTSSPED